MTRAALPLVVLAGIGEMLGSTLSAWGATDSIAVVAVLGSQFAAIAAVMAYFLFGERLSRSQTMGVVLIIAGVTAARGDEPVTPYTQPMSTDHQGSET